jgi:magnesium chelatase subunit I
MNYDSKTLGELIENGYREKTIKLEMAENLVEKIKNREELFPSIHGYEDTVIPQMIHAILSGHNIVLLGEKGQAKTKIMRSLISLLDPKIPILEGTEIPESPFSPITLNGRRMISELKEKTPIRWLDREDRYGERLAPGAKIGDIIGDLEPSKIVSGEPLSSEGAIHFGLLPRMNKGIFAINEIPDLDYLVQVSLFNVMEESDIQIRGIPVRFALDVFICFTANPEDYSRNGKIITQLKDRIGSEIRTHYPKTRDISLKITQQEINLPVSSPPVFIPDFIEHIIEEITIQARTSPYINQKSGVSARLSIANSEIAISSARKRALIHREDHTYVRMTDLGNLFSSSSGKIDLDVYRDESITEYQVFLNLYEQAVKVIFVELYPVTKYKSEIDEVLKQIYKLEKIEISDMMPTSEYQKILQKIPTLWELASAYKFDKNEKLFVSSIEFILEGLVSIQKLSKQKLGSSYNFKTVHLY